MLAPFIYAGGMTFVSSTMTIQILTMFPTTRGLVSSLLSFGFMVVFSLIAGVVCPLLYVPVHASGSALPMSAAIFVAMLLSLLFWKLGGGTNKLAPAIPVPIEEPGLVAKT